MPSVVRQAPVILNPVLIARTPLPPPPASFDLHAPLRLVLRGTRAQAAERGERGEADTAEDAGHPDPG
jgi:hypothetical protein